MFESQIKAIESLDVMKEFKEVIKSLADKFVELNQDNLSEGKRADGAKLPPYSDAYASKKGKSKTPKTLYDLGGLYQGIKLNTLPVNYVELTGSDWKTEILQHNWGIEILGVTDKDIEMIQSMAIPLLNQRIQNALA